MEKLFPVIDNIFRTTAAAGAGLKRSLGIRGECFLAIHTLIVLISRFDRISGSNSLSTGSCSSIS